MSYVQQVLRLRIPHDRACVLLAYAQLGIEADTFPFVRAGTMHIAAMLGVTMADAHELESWLVSHSFLVPTSAGFMVVIPNGGH
ncbi:hypothetical protein [Cupriavidus oxalaticus]|uniref:Uncharacterized protein n=1 Tax=Cupriavidus oxalaticus TaxID=96344 RepID=A0A5P3VEC4_9BURK|nr:hypothetical protein [Cupriavidus oxalaticus]QEZ44717.1 hypothetical protein D2917_11045 [Cupriavidus oxalaticus]